MPLRLIASILMAIIVSLTDTPQVVASNPPVELWSQTLTGTTAAIGSFDTDMEGNLYMSTSGFLNHVTLSSSFLSKLDRNGAELWKSEFPAQFISGSLTDSLGNTYVAGRSVQGPWMAKVSSDGNVLWNKVSPFHQHTSSRGLVRDSQGFFYTTGTTFESDGMGGFTDRNAYIRKVSPEGETLWLQEFGGIADDSGLDLEIDSSDNLYVASNTSPDYSNMGEPLSTTKTSLRKFDSQGSLLWTREITGDEDVYGSGFAVDPNGIVSLGGSSSDNQGNSAAILRSWDSEGNELFTDLIGDSPDYVRQVFISKDGDLYVSGLENGQDFLRNLDYSGNVEWSRERMRSGLSDSQDIRAITLDDHGNIFIGGASGIISSTGFLIKLRSIPEPSTSTLALVALWLAMGRRRR